ncbi:MAG: PHP domain-containing protein, partial [Ruminococcaceae bacterium]|nr:PHP domain-containing protein [Oscillospiraceae bacterium]
MNLLDRFPKYTPSDDLLKYMSAQVDKLRIDKEQRMMEVDIISSIIIPKLKLYQLEEEIKNAYSLNFFRIYPKYDKELFNSDYLDELVQESYRQGIVSKGFFEDYSTSFSKEKIVFKVPFIQGGIELLTNGKTSDVISKIIYDEFGLRIPVSIEQREDYKKNQEFFESEKINILKRALEEQKRAQSSNAKKEATAEKAQAIQSEFKRANSFFTNDVTIEKEGNIIKCGNISFDISNKEYVVGGEFEIENIVPIRNLDVGMYGVCVLGTVFDIAERQINRGSTTLINVSLTDNDSSIFIKITVPTSKKDEELSYFKKGNAYAIRCSVKKNEYDGEPYISYLDVYKIGIIKRKDNAEDKRVELHLHTVMSALDATIDPDRLVDTIKEWGHKAVAITDHGNVQGYPPIMVAAEKKGVNIIYGMEAYFVNDTAADTSRVIFGPKGAVKHGSFKDEYCVFDIETTGLSLAEDKITEIGAVIVKDGEIISKYNALVNPQR